MPLAIGGSSFLEIRDDPGDGVQHFSFGLRLGNALQRGSGGAGMAAAAQQTADLRSVDPLASTERKLPNTVSQLPHGHGAVHPLDLGA